MSDHPPLQAADVLCWYLQRAYSGVSLEPPDQQNMDVFSSRKVCGYEITEQDVANVTDSVLRREQQYATAADRFAKTVSHILKIPKSVIMAEMEKEDRSLKRKKKT
jgi:hypothetical protein